MRIGWWILFAFLAFGFYRNRRFLKQWSKDWWVQMKWAWRGKNG